MITQLTIVAITGFVLFGISNAYAWHDEGGRISIGDTIYTWTRDWIEYDITYIDGIPFTTDHVSRNLEHEYTYTVTIVNKVEPQYDKIIEQKVDEAFQSWDDVNVDLSFIKITDQSKANINILVDKSTSSYSRLYGTTYGDAVVGCILSELATCTIRIYTEWDDRDDLRNLLNPNFAKHVTAHEIGHAFGLGHHPDPNNIMYSKGDRTDKWFKSLSVTTPQYGLIPEERQILPARVILSGNLDEIDKTATEDNTGSETNTTQQSDTWDDIFTIEPTSVCDAILIASDKTYQDLVRYILNPPTTISTIDYT